MLPNFVKIRAGLSTEKHEILVKSHQREAILAEKHDALLKCDEPSDSPTLADEISVLSDDIAPSAFHVHEWDKKSGFSDYIAGGLRELKRDTSNAIMLFESPSSSNPESPFYNSQVFKFHLSPSAPTNPAQAKSAKSTLGPYRYSLFNGTAFPTYNRYGEPPSLLLDHWDRSIPGFERPRFVSEIDDDAQVYAYLPCETIKKHVNCPHIHYHLAGKENLRLMTDKTTELLPNTRVERPCIAKTTHSMASKGIFVIRSDEDEREFEEYIAISGKPNYVVNEFVNIARNVACHFYIHPSGDITWFGSNENHMDENGNWSLDSYLIMDDQDLLKEIQLPFVRDVAAYCHSLGFFGFCGVDVLFDATGKGYLVDVNPRVTGSCPSLMVAQLLQDQHGFTCGLFRRSGDICYHGPEEQLFAEVETFNEMHEGTCKVIIFAVCPMDEMFIKINIGVYGNSTDKCKLVLNHFARPKTT